MTIYTLDRTHFRRFANEIRLQRWNLSLKQKAIVGKGENPRYHHFLLYPRCFQQTFLLTVVKT